jgi:aryl-alcohol dehydrogenase-like predicted oxidoreductase
MEFRFLGNSGLKVSAITYGNWVTHGSSRGGSGDRLRAGGAGGWYHDVRHREHVRERSSPRRFWATR